MQWYSEQQLKGLKLSFSIKRKIYSGRSNYQKIDILETESHGILLALDKKIMLTERDEFIYHEMISHIPLYTHKNPKNVLIIGGGDGGTVRECLKHKNLLEVDLCEIDDKVIALSKKYLPFTANKLNDKKVNIYIQDGFEFLKSKRNYYDVVIVDSTDPVGEAKKLFEKSFFNLVKDSLKKGGIMCAQCESPFYFADTIYHVNRDLKNMFKHVGFYTAPVITYPSGYWSFVIASDSTIKLRPNGLGKLKYKNKYFNRDIYESSFALPTFFKELIQD